MKRAARRNDRFNLQPGQSFGGKYVVEAFLGGGVEGEVYKVRETRTKISRAAKLFYPSHNERDRAARAYARKLEHLRHCPLVIQYHNAETLLLRGKKITCLLSDYVDGMLLSDYAGTRSGKRLPPFEALHIFHTIICGLEQIHAVGEYHGDLHDENVLIKRCGIFFDIKILDFFHWGRPIRTHQKHDIVDAVRILYYMVGGPGGYAKLPPGIKSICLGMRRDLIVQRFPTATRLRQYLERTADLLP
jgi:Protein kinase domain